MNLRIEQTTDETYIKSVLFNPITDHTSIRFSYVGDLAGLAHIGQSFYTEAKLGARFIPETFVKSWAAIIESGCGKIILLETGGVPIGALGFLVHRDLYDGVLTASETFWYVLPEHRGDGPRLLKAFEEHAISIGAKRIIMGYLEHLMPKVLSLYYQRLGFHPIEHTFMKEL